MNTLMLFRGPLIMLLLLFVFDTGLLGQSNILQGTVIMPDAKPKARITRGQAYRNRRGGTASSGRNRTGTANQPQNNVIISLKPLTFHPVLSATKEAYIRQKGKAFLPNVLPVTVGTTVYFINDDPFYHNVFSITPKARFNIGRRPAGTSHGRRIDKVGEVKVFCDIHPQMRATVLSLATPYFTRVDSEGNYQISGLPDGTYQPEIYYGNQRKTAERIKVSGGRTVKRDFNLATGTATSFFMGPDRDAIVMCSRKSSTSNPQ